MSYSRWSNSVFYCFWSATKSERLNDQLFDVCGVKAFTYKELKNDMEGCIDKIKKLTTATNPGLFVAKSYTDEEYEELRGYMRTFIKDVEQEFCTKQGKINRMLSKIQDEEKREVFEQLHGKKKKKSKK